MGGAYISVFVLFFIILYYAKRRKVFLKKLIKARSKEEKSEMLNLAKSFVNKDCLIYLFENQVHCVIKEIGDKGILVSKEDGNLEIINSDFIVRIREYPKKKNGKNKSVILD